MNGNDRNGSKLERKSCETNTHINELIMGKQFWTLVGMSDYILND